jgi:V8-like Glu-specific endopeptidase
LLTIKTKPKETCVYAHTAELQNGSSGSPVFNSKGDIIGIHFGAMPNHKGSFFITNEGIINCIEHATKI